MAIEALRINAGRDEQELEERCAERRARRPIGIEVETAEVYHVTSVNSRGSKNVRRDLDDRRRSKRTRLKCQHRPSMLRRRSHQPSLASEKQAKAHNVPPKTELLRKASTTQTAAVDPRPSAERVLAYSNASSGERRAKSMGIPNGHVKVAPPKSHFSSPIYMALVCPLILRQS
jgi:hypothetical protein